jgi:hypothetical protein
MRWAAVVNPRGSYPGGDEDQTRLDVKRGCGMERVQHNGGTAGIITAICLVLLFILYVSSGLDVQSAQDPAKALPVLGQKAGVFAAVGVLGLLAAGFGLLFTFGWLPATGSQAPPFSWPVGRSSRRA